MIIISVDWFAVCFYHKLSSKGFISQVSIDVELRTVHVIVTVIEVLWEIMVIIVTLLSDVDSASK